ncbi:MAG: biopolymer transporter ExbD [Hyphomicrobiales bacterium]|nr:biopolymer transporter ExbD [Rickettsiales bacterium]MCP5361097.1 biopolymer transporter ExbD [Hyphomicrobiales bacterium]
MEIPRRKTSRKELSIIPLINIIFLLLIFFLLAGTIGTQDDPVQVPEAESGEQVLHPDPLEVLLTAQGGMQLNHRPVSPGMLEQTLRYRLNVMPGQPVIISADGLLPAAQLIEVMRIVSSAGARDVMIATAPREEG